MSSGKIVKAGTEKTDSRIAANNIENWERAKEAIQRIVSRGNVYQDREVFKWLPASLYASVASFQGWEEVFFMELGLENRITVIRYMDSDGDMRWILLPRHCKPTLRIL